jgi:hypothetical protein
VRSDCGDGSVDVKPVHHELIEEASQQRLQIFILKKRRVRTLEMEGMF